MVAINCYACKQAGSEPSGFDPPPLVIDPAVRRYGQPTFGTSALSAGWIAKLVYEVGVDRACETYPFLSHDQVALACWWMGAGTSKRWRRRWGAWALDAGLHMLYGCGTFPDPPTREDQK